MIRKFPAKPCVGSPVFHFGVTPLKTSTYETSGGARSFGKGRRAGVMLIFWTGEGET